MRSHHIIYGALFVAICVLSGCSETASIENFTTADMKHGSGPPGDCSIGDQVRTQCNGKATCDFIPLRNMCKSPLPDGERDKFTFVDFVWKCTDGTEHSARVNFGARQTFRCS